MLSKMQLDFWPTLNTTGDQQLDINKLALSLVKSSEDVDNYIRFDDKNGIYIYYSLIRINKSLAEAGVKRLPFSVVLLAVRTIKALATTACA